MWAMGGALPATIARYEILEVLGRGAIGTVYRARVPGSSTTVALKVVSAVDAGQ